MSEKVPRTFHEKATSAKKTTHFKELRPEGNRLMGNLPKSVQSSIKPCRQKTMQRQRTEEKGSRNSLRF